jgi:hypothetical protein
LIIGILRMLRPYDHMGQNRDLSVLSYRISNL